MWTRGHHKQNRLYEFFWHLANRGRRLIGRPAIPKNCCRQPENLKQIEQIRPDFCVRTCKQCRCRHHELTVDPAAYTVKFN